jgi:hypothetical protein
LIVFLFIIFSSSQNFDLLDNSISLFPVNEETLYYTSRKSIRISQGFPIDEYKYRYNVNYEVPLISKLSLYYRFHKSNKFDLDEEFHRFEINWIPEKSDFLPLTYSFVIAPCLNEDNDMIVTDLLGLGVGYWRNKANNHWFYIIVEDFYNKDRYCSLPCRYEMEGRIRSNWASLYYYYCYTFFGRKSCFEPLNVFKRKKESSKELNLSSHYHLLRNLIFGLRLRYIEGDSLYISYSLDDYFHWYFFTEPFIEIHLFENDELHIGFPMIYDKESNEFEYEKREIGFNLINNHNFYDWLNFQFGILKSWEINKEEGDKLSGIFGIELRFKKKTYIALRKGLVFDSDIRNTFKNFDKHLFILVSHHF